MIVAHAFVDRNQHSCKGGRNDAQDHGPNPRPDNQLGTFVGIIGHRSEQKIILIKGCSHIKQKVENDNPHNNQYGLGRQLGRERVETYTANAGQQYAEEKKRLVLSDFGSFSAIHQKSLNGIIHGIKDPRKQKKRCSQGRPHSAQPGVVGHILHKHTGHKHGTQTIYSRQRRCAETVPQRNCVRIFHTDRLEHYYPPCHFINYSQPTKPEFVQFQQFNDRLFLCIPQ